MKPLSKFLKESAQGKRSRKTVLLVENEVSSDEDFKEYATTVLKQAHGDAFDKGKADDTIDGILKKCGNDYGACVGSLTTSLTESRRHVNENVNELADLVYDYKLAYDSSHVQSIKREVQATRQRVWERLYRMYPGLKDVKAEIGSSGDLIMHTFGINSKSRFGQGMYKIHGYIGGGDIRITLTSAQHTTLMEYLNDLKGARVLVKARLEDDAARDAVDQDDYETLF